MEGLSQICLFVRNIPYSTTASELQGVFEKYGPLRSCYTVKEKGGAEQCRGFAYVTYEKREDAQRAKSEVKVIGGRPVQLIFASRKKIVTAQKVAAPSIREARTKEEEDDYEALTASKDSFMKPHRSRSQRNSPKFDIGRIIVLKNLPHEAKEKRIQKICEKFGNVEGIVYPVNSDFQVAHVTYSTHVAARQAVKGLNGTKYRKKYSSILSISLLSKESKTVSKKTLLKSRLIVRNLSFKCSEEDVKEIFEQFGTVISVHIPHKDNGQVLGYCFVQYNSYFNASTALAAVNGTEIKGRRVDVDWVLPKTEYRNMQEHQRGKVVERDQTEEPNGKTISTEEVSKEDELSEGESGDGKASGNEMGDWVSKEEMVEKVIEGEAEEDSGEEMDEEGHGGKVNEGNREAMDEDIRYKVAQKVDHDDVNEGRTVFIRNLPFTTDYAFLKKVMLQFGAVKYCRVMLNKETAVCMGTAFVQFKDPSSTQRCLRAAECPDGGVMYGGQKLNISVALPRREVEKIYKEKVKLKEDKRNLYLAKEGAIFPDSEAAKDLSKLEMAKRLKVYAEKKAKLANSHFFVSKTRLCVRNLPTHVDEKKLKAVFQNSMGNPTAKVLQVKLLRSTERVDGRGVGRSKGYGFVEFSSHESALTALRAINNNPTIFGKAKRPIVEFAVEDSRVMKLREQRKSRQAVLQRDLTGSGANGFIVQKKLTKRQKWQLKWQSRRHKRKETKLLEANEGQEVSGIKRVEDSMNNDVKRFIKKSRKRTLEESDIPSKRKKLLEEDSSRRNVIQISSRGQIKEVPNRRRAKIPSRRRGRNIEKHHTNIEESNFARMVDKYKQKLAGY